VAATREMTGSKKVKQNTESKEMVVSKMGITTDAQILERRASLKKNQIVVEFAAERYSVLESCKDCFIPIVKTGGEPGTIVTVKYSTRDGTAKAEQDYTMTEGELVFKADGFEKQDIRIPIIDDAAYEEDEDFFVDIIRIDVAGPAASTSQVLGDKRVATITIIDDDEPGVLAFESEQVDLIESAEDTMKQITVVRKSGSTGKISCHYHTENDSAIAPTDFDTLDGEVEFESGQMSATIDVNIKAKGRYEGKEMFRLVLSDPKNNAKFDTTTDGGAELNICSIYIYADESQKKAVDNMAKVLKLNWDKARIGTTNWKDQFVNALKVNGGDDDSDAPSCQDYIMHVCSCPWKVFFAMIPPTDYFGGWLCFGVALAFIGGVTAIIGDMAGLLGCVMNIPDSITAITFVALGTSLPDTFASKSAAVQDAHADASIGNVTGSNSVNVFLGLGLPWLIGSIYWHGNPTGPWKEKYPELAQKYPEGGFVVKSGDLGFSVTVFTLVAIVCLITLVIRRKVVGAELGGPKGSKIASAVFFVALWFVYVGLSSWNAIQSENSKK
jgi:solute carrier family 8 (sodium/calcium exchanger)